ncbi:MAG: hypothetical protein HeimC3_47990 [Candidatus Heimdallarchaeota archaeon LC_3]|nr:MAG: hypothetical protein HeimC3_47990 [Candidatus Heimdallarchaeota archaeon LC_3]
MIDIAKEELNNYDVIISDYRMDAIDGVLINKFLKSKSIITLFILISSFDYAEIKKHYSINICDYFVQKKIFIEEFCQDIEQCISKITDHTENHFQGTKIVFSETVNFVKQYN